MGRKKKSLGTDRRSRRRRKRETAKPSSPPHLRTRTFVRSGNETKSKEEGKESEEDGGHLVHAFLLLLLSRAFKEPEERIR